MVCKYNALLLTKVGLGISLTLDTLGFNLNIIFSSLIKENINIEMFSSLELIEFNISRGWRQKRV